MELSKSNETLVPTNCATHGTYQAKVIDLMGREIKTGCPACAAESNRRAEQQRIELERKAAESRRKAALESAGIPKRFEACTLGNYHAAAAGQQRALDACNDLVAAVIARHDRIGSLMLCGNPGTGKTHLAVGVVAAVLAGGRSATKVNVSDMVRMVRETWGRGDVTERAVYDRLGAVDLLVIDELGVQTGSDNEKQIIFEVLNRRYESCLPTMILSNLGPDGVKAELGERVTDRLREDGGRMIACDWESHRRSAAKATNARAGDEKAQE